MPHQYVTSLGGVVLKTDKVYKGEIFALIQLCKTGSKQDRKFIIFLPLMSLIYQIYKKVKHSTLEKEF